MIETPMPGPGAPGPGMIPPGSTAPASVPPVPEGQQQAGRALIMTALSALEKGLMMMGSASPEGKAVIESLSKLTKLFGTPAQDIGAASLKQLAAAANPNAGPSAAQQQEIGDVQSKIMERLSGMGMQAQPPAAPEPAMGAPMGAPPGM